MALLLLVTLVVGMPGEASAHGDVTYHLDVNTTYSWSRTNNPPGPYYNCGNYESHGNIFGTAFAKVMITSGQCTAVLVIVTGCANSTCLDDPTGWHGGSSYGTWYQSQMTYYSVLWSHYLVYTAGWSTLDHANVF